MSTLKKHARYSPCRECSFLVTVNETYCPNCGIIMPRWKLPAPTLQISRNSMIAGGVMFCLLRIGLLLWRGGGGEVSGNLWPLLKGSVFFGIFFGMVFSAGKFFIQRAKHQGVTRALQRRSTSSLRHSENAIMQRLEEMRTREQQIGDTLRDIVEASVQKPSQKILDTFESSLAALQIQRDRYMVKLWEIELIRWYQPLKALTEDVETLTYDRCDARIKSIHDTIAGGTEMLEAWENKSSLTRAQQDCIARLHNALKSCEQLRRDLLSHKAALAVRGLSPLDEQFQSAPTVSKLLEELDVFSVLPDVGEFSSGLKALDAEYFRLKGEEEVHQEFESEHNG